MSTIHKRKRILASPTILTGAAEPWGLLKALKAEAEEARRAKAVANFILNGFDLILLNSVRMQFMSKCSTRFEDVMGNGCG